MTGAQRLCMNRRGYGWKDKQWTFSSLVAQIYLKYFNKIPILGPGPRDSGGVTGLIFFFFNIPCMILMCNLGKESLM